MSQESALQPCYTRPYNDCLHPTLTPSICAHSVTHKLPQICSFNQSARTEPREPHGHQGPELTHRQVSALDTTGCQMMQNISQKAQKVGICEGKERRTKGWKCYTMVKWSMNDWNIQPYLSLPPSLICLTLIWQWRSIKILHTEDFVLPCLVTQTRTHAVSQVNVAVH